MKEQFINDTCSLFSKHFAHSDMDTVRNILAMSLDGYRLEKENTDLVVYEGDQNEQMLKAFLVAKKVNGLADRTLQFYNTILISFFKAVGKRADEINANDIRLYFARRELNDRVSSVTRNNERRTLSTFYQWMNDEGFISNNPVRKIAQIKGKKEKKKAFSQMEIEKIRNGASNEKETAVIETLLSTGCRVSELCGIRVDEIQDDQVLVHGKGNKDRTCYLTAKAQLAINKWMKTQHFKKRHSLGSPYLFPRERMNENELLLPMSTGGVESMVRDIGKRSGVEKCHPHRFRRTCATMALKRGMPIEQVSKMLGHESINTTQIYLDLDEESLKNAHKKYVI